MMIKDLTGNKFGLLTALMQDGWHYHPNAQRTAKWLCQCDCGKTVSVIGRNLTNGATKSCGCYRKKQNNFRCFVDLTKKRFGRLIVINQDGWHYHPSGQRHSKWLCQCDCGKFCSTLGPNLMNGQTTSCGCDNTEQNVFRRFKDLTGKRFNHLLVIRQDGWQNSTSGRTAMWLCQCDCGGKISVVGGSLSSNNTTSCGCYSGGFPGTIRTFYCFDALNANEHHTVIGITMQELSRRYRYLKKTWTCSTYFTIDGPNWLICELERKVKQKFKNVCSGHKNLPIGMRREAFLPEMTQNIFLYCKQICQENNLIHNLPEFAIDLDKKLPFITAR